MRLADALGEVTSAGDTDLVIPGPEAVLVDGDRRRVRPFAEAAVLRTDGGAGPPRSRRKSLRPGARHDSLGDPRAPRSPVSTTLDADGAIDVVE